MTSDSKQERVMYRSKLARSITGDETLDDVLIVSRETISQFGINEWKLVERLEEAEDDQVTVGIRGDYSAAVTLAENDMVTIEEAGEEEHTVTKKHSGPVIMPVFEG